MAEAGPSAPRAGGGDGGDGGDSRTKQKKKHWLASNARGGRGGGRGGGGGRGRGGGPGGRGGAGAAGGPKWTEENGEKRIAHLGRYREDPPVRPSPSSSGKREKSGADGQLEMMIGPGILVMAIQNKERSAEKELILHLEDVADQLYPETSEEDAGGGEGDFEDMLQRELQGMGQQNKSARFILYINVLPPLDPVRLVQHVLASIEETGQSPFKFISRIVPISIVGGATLPQLSAAAKEVVQSGFATDDDRPLKTWSRKTDRLDRLDMIRKVAEEVEALGKGHSVDLSHPDRTVIVEVFKNSIGVAVLQDFDRFKKYNPGAVAAAAAKRLNGVGVPKPSTASEEAVAPATETEEIAADAGPEVTMSPPPAAAPKDPPSTGKLPKHYHRKLNAAMANAEYQVAQNMSKRKADEETKEAGGDEAMEEIIEDGKVYKLART